MLMQLTVNLKLAFATAGTRTSGFPKLFQRIRTIIHSGFNGMNIYIVANTDNHVGDPYR